MGQYIPALEWSERALVLRKFVFDFWAETGRGPNLRQAGAGTGLSRRDIVQAYKELQTGIVVVVDQDSPNCDLLKAPPYSAFPSQVEMYIDDKFHSFIGCAHEAVAVSNMPQFRDIEVRLESYCACCLEPITFWAKNFEIQRYEPFEPAVHVATPMWDWVHDDMKAMCDNTNLVFDREHAGPLRATDRAARRSSRWTRCAATSNPRSASAVGLPLAEPVDEPGEAHRPDARSRHRPQPLGRLTGVRDDVRHPARGDGPRRRREPDLPLGRRSGARYRRPRQLRGQRSVLARWLAGRRRRRRRPARRPRRARAASGRRVGSHHPLPRARTGTPVDEQWIRVEGDDPDRPGMHATDTLDFMVVLDGEIVLGLDDGEHTLGPGDTVIQRGTAHRWRVAGDRPCIYAVHVAHRAGRACAAGRARPARPRTRAGRDRRASRDAWTAAAGHRDRRRRPLVRVERRPRADGLPARGSRRHHDGRAVADRRPPHPTGPGGDPTGPWELEPRGVASRSATSRCRWPTTRATPAGTRRRRSTSTSCCRAV